MEEKYKHLCRWDRSLADTSVDPETRRFRNPFAPYLKEISAIEDRDERTEVFNALVADEKHYGELYIVASLLVLCISPLVWFFSQALYYKKRENEFNILQAMGAVLGQIRSIYLQGGLSMACMSLVVSVALSYAGSYILFLVYNVVMPHITGEHVRYVFYMPWYAILASVVLSVACGFLSAYLPFSGYRKYRQSLQNGGGGKEFGDER